MKKQFRSLVAAGLLAALASVSQASISYGSNLVVNGDAESGTAGWQSYAGYSPIQSVDYGDNWVKPSQPGPADRGSKMFTGTGGYAVGYQMLDLGGTTTQALGYSLSGWLGGWAAQGDNALFYVSFLGADGMEIAGAALGPVYPADRGNATGLWYQEALGLLPVGTSALGFWLSMERQGGGDNDGYADNLAFVLQAPAQVPEPQTLALLALSLGLLAVQRQRARR
jgi:hypothetical protein